VPVVQKALVAICRDNAKPVIVATQMLESMITHSRPTRAEASDVANAVLDGADAVMLSGETSVGAYPVQTVATMDRIVREVERSAIGVAALLHRPRSASGVMSMAAKDISDSLDAVALVAFTQSGDTARRLARLHSKALVLAFTPDECVQRQLALSWGVDAHRRDGSTGRFGPAGPAHLPSRRSGGHRRRNAALDPGRHEHDPGAQHRWHSST
jgi:pyruvate kinase